MKKYKIFKKFILPTSVISGVSSALALASCTSTNNSIKITYSNEISSSNMLDDMQAKLNLASSSEFFLFPKDVNVSNIKFTDFTRNNYIGQYVEFNKDNLKKLLKKEFPNEQAFIDSLKFKIRYHDIRQNENNINQTIIPVELRHDLNSDKHLYEIRTIDFVVNNLGSKTDPKLEKLTGKFNEFTQLLKVNKPTVSINSDDKIVKKVIGNDRLDELSNEQLNQLFTIELPQVITQKINELWEKDNINTNIFVDNVSFDSKLNQAIVSLRVALADQNDEVQEFLKKPENKEKTFTKAQLLQEVGKLSKLNIGTNVSLSVNYSNSTLNSYLLNEQLAQLVKINIKEGTVASYNFKTMKISDFTFYKPEQFSSLTLESTKALDSKNAQFTFKAKDAKNGQEYTFTKHLGLGKYADFFKQELAEENQKAYNFITGPLTREDLTKVNAQIFSLYGNKILSGGYDELRGFYASSPRYPYQLHLGEDYLAKEKTPILAPYDGEILGIVYHDYVDQAKNLAQGIGTTLLMRVKVADLNLSPREKEMYFKDSEYAYIGMIHLDQELTFKNQELGIGSKQRETTSGTNRSVDTYATVLDPKTNQQVAITPTNPLKVTKGQIIAYIGKTSENGGWMTHVHVTVTASGTKNWNANGFYSQRKDYYESRIKSYTPDGKSFNWAGIRAQGVLSSSTDFAHQTNPKSPAIDPKTGKTLTPKADGKGNYEFAVLPIQDKELRDGLRDPNILFKVRSKETYAFDINDLFKINQ
ncbi:hypothetical protein NPA11_01805 [Mycoplasma sp. 1578d]|uniref:MSC_0775 family lipoprotein n=1 Tax=Mycoplasma sp. 1578d TaxID=2967299 RepID=UPI00211BA7D8|nr:hypothetical protein [Mycoplasma sp. 1578d]UUM20140.1 hypothetical protein NPA11_01805 [Mycoplasma sp. 1578d]